MNKNGRKITSVIAAAVTALALTAAPAAGGSAAVLSGFGITAGAVSGLPYMNANGEYKTRSSFSEITSGTTELSGWYSVSGSVTISGRLRVTDDTYIVLTDGSTLTVKGGIEVASGVKFNVYTQENGTGTLYAGTANGRTTTASYGDCGIGGKGAKINIVGGNVYARGGADSFGIYGSDIHLYWTNPTDSVYASSYSSKVQVLSAFVDKTNGAAYNNSYVSASSINGVTLNAAYTVDKNTTYMSDGSYAVFDNVKISDRISVQSDVDLYLAQGGTLTADEGITVDKNAVLNIYGNGGKLFAGTRNGNTFLARDNNAGIGSASGNQTGDIIINSGIVYANGGRNAAGIGGNNAFVQILGGTVNAAGGIYGAGIGSGYGENGSVIDILGGTVNAAGGSNAAGVGNGYRSSGSSIRLSYTGSSDSIYASSFSGSVNFLKTMYTAGGQVATSQNISGTKLTSRVTAFTVTFEANNGEYIAPKTVAAGTAIQMMPYVTRKGYTFDGWYTDRNLTYRFNANSAINQNLTLYAKWTADTYTVTFETNGAEYVPAQTVTAGTAIRIMPYVTRNGYTFDGWYTDRNFIYRFNSDSAINSNITLYAKWTKDVDTATLTFYVDGRKQGSMSVNIGQYVGILDFSVLLTSDLDGWYTDKSCSNRVGDSYYVYGNASLYAQTKASTITVTFYSFGNYFTSRTLNKGEAIGACESPKAEPGFTFTGWYLDTNLRNPIDNYTKFYEDTVLYAGWDYAAPKTYSINFYLDNEYMDTQYVNEGEYAVNNRFVSEYNWYTASNRPFSFTEPIYQDYDLYATRHINSYTVNIYIDGAFVESQTVNEGLTIVTQPGYYNYTWTTASGVPFDISTPIYMDYDLYASSYTASTFNGGGLIAAIAGGAAALGGGFAAGFAVGKKKKKDE